MIIAIVTFILTFLILALGFLTYKQLENQRRKRVIQVINSGKRDPSSLDKNNNSKKYDLTKKLKAEEGNGKKNNNSIEVLILHAGFETNIKIFWLYSVLCSFIVTIFAYILGQPTFVVFAAFIIGLLGLPKLFLKMKAKKRQKKFMLDMPDALEAMVRLLKAGMPVSEAISMVAREFSGPMGEEMSRVFDQQKIGIPLPEAVLNASKRMPLTEMQMFATAIAIQTQTGSSLSEVLQNLANVVRARFQLKRKVNALSSEAKASAGIIGALPLLVLGGMYLVNRDYIIVLFEDPRGNALLFIAAFWMLCGILVMRQMINFRI